MLFLLSYLYLWLIQYKQKQWDVFYIQMKFQKVLIAVYALTQILMAASLFTNGNLTPVYIVFTIMTLGLYIATYLRDPGYLLVDQTRQQPQHSEQIEDEQMDIGIKEDKKNKSRYCRICMINQPFRTKHCHECEKCVATFDHHCPWMCNCIGQKNRPIFLLYLVAQSFQFFFAAFGICSVAVNKTIPNTTQLILGLVLILILSIVLGLTIFQAYLMLVNVTTWQLSKWDKIDYLNKYSRNQGSPFSKGLMRNTIDFWVWGFRSSRKIWEFESN